MKAIYLFAVLFGSFFVLPESRALDLKIPPKKDAYRGSKKSGTWNCAQALGHDFFKIIPVQAKDAYWIPEGASLVAFQAFRAQAPTLLMDSHGLIELLDGSPLFRRAITMFVQATSQDYLPNRPESLFLYQEFLKSLFNEGRARTRAMEAISDFLVRIKADQALNQTANGKPASAVEKTIDLKWNENGENFVQEWVLADPGPSSPSSAEELLVTASSLSSVAVRLQSMRNERLFKPGELFSDAFILSLDPLGESIAELESHFVNIKSASSGVASAALLREQITKAVSEGNSEKAVEALSQSIDLYEESRRFVKAYQSAAEQISYVVEFTNMNEVELRKLSTIIRERILLYSLELNNTAFSYQTHSEPYLSLKREILALNAQMLAQAQHLSDLANPNLYLQP